MVALYGCKQTAAQIGRTFVDRSYLNEYADTNGLVVLYPQARPDETFNNPNGCWTGGATSAPPTATTPPRTGRRCVQS